MKLFTILLESITFFLLFVGSLVGDAYILLACYGVGMVTFYLRSFYTDYQSWYLIAANRVFAVCFFAALLVAFRNSDLMLTGNQMKSLFGFGFGTLALANLFALILRPKDKSSSS